MDSFAEKTLKEFTDRLSASDSVPGGGGAAALGGAMGASLGCMVCRLTIGKAAYRAVESDIVAALNQLESFRNRLLALVDADAEGFAPLEKAWALPKEDPERPEKLEAALRAACEIPAAVIETAAVTIGVLAEVAERGAKSAISDVGVGVELCKAAVFGSKQNIFINAALMRDKAFAALVREQYYRAETQCMPAADRALAIVAARVG
jgi:formiminotetrahydrofolate cyclodeaminase